MRSLGTALLFALLALACGGGGAPPPDDGRDDAPSASPSAEEPSSEQPSSDEPSAGRPVEVGPDGIPVDCPFRVGDLCYAESDAACHAAGCDPDACLVLESYPAQIRCRE